MNKYCRYCAHCFVQDEEQAVCGKTNRMVNKRTIRNACMSFEFCEIDAFYFNRSENPMDAVYKPRRPKNKQCDGQLKMEV